MNMVRVRVILAVVLAVGIYGFAAVAQDAAPGAAPAMAAEGQEEADEKDLQNKLLPLTEMETAFKKALVTRNRLATFVQQQEQKLKEVESEDEKMQIRKDIGAARKRLQTLSVAMDVIFGIGGSRQYNYDEVTSTIYLRVGTAEEVFVRAIRARDLYTKFIAEQKAALDKETDEAKKKEIQGKVDEGTRRWQLVAASLQQIYGVTPKRDYSYNPKNSTLYLKVSENELEKLKAQLEKLQEERRAKEGEAAAGEKAGQ
ncbi:MAG: hypothetical protein JXR77_19185 [Lentisphaeria bacterium]|nr:hypothetical protein [Lentisphaeria bacterium]